MNGVIPKRSPCVCSIIQATGGLLTVKPLPTPPRCIGLPFAQTCSSNVDAVAPPSEYSIQDSKL